jgi:hypothetical protein
MKSIFSIVFLLMTVSNYAQRFDWVAFAPLTDVNSSEGSGGLAVEYDNAGHLYTTTTFSNSIVIGNDTVFHQGPASNVQNILIIKWTEQGEAIDYVQLAQDFALSSAVYDLEYDDVNNQIILSLATQGSPLTVVGQNISIPMAYSAILRFTTDLDYISKIDRPASYFISIEAHDGFLYDLSGYNSVITKMDVDNNVIWNIPQAMSSTAFSMYDMTITEDGLIYIVGEYVPSIFFSAVGYGDVMVIPPINAPYHLIFKLTIEGEVLDGEALSPSSNHGYRVATDFEGNVFVTVPYSGGGFTVGNIVINPPTGATDAFIAKLDDNFNVNWITELHHTGGNMKTFDINVHPSGELMVIGSYGGNASPGGFTLEFSPYGSGFFVQLDNSTGNVNYAESIGAPSSGTNGAYDFEIVGNKYFISGLSYTSLGNASFGCFDQSYSTHYLACFNDIEYSHDISLFYDSQFLTANSTGDNPQYVWYFNNELIEGATSFQLSPFADGEYSVVATDQYNCSAEASIMYLGGSCLAANYPLDASAEDISGNQLHGVMAGGVTPMTNRFGEMDKAMHFDGIDGRIDLPTDFDFESRTWSFWLNAENITAVPQVIFDCDHENIEFGQTEVSVSLVEGEKRLYLLMGQNLHFEEIEENTWYHVALTRNANEMTFYFNGCSVASFQNMTNDHSVDGLSTVSLGRGRFHDDFFFEGGLDDVQIFDCTLTPAEISSLADNAVCCETSFSVDEQTACFSYTWIDGITYTENNSSATYTLQNSTGCDSVITLNLNLISFINTVNLDLEEGVLTSDVQNAEYQWLDCNNKFDMIDGETNQSFVPAASGNFAVNVFLSGCNSVSDCVEVDITKSIEEYDSSLLKMYPNPGDGIFRLQVESLQNLHGFFVYNNVGQMVYASTTWPSNGMIDLGFLPDGNYAFVLQGLENIQQFKFIIKH